MIKTAGNLRVLWLAAGATVLALLSAAVVAGVMVVSGSLTPAPAPVQPSTRLAASPAAEARSRHTEIVALLSARYYRSVDVNVLNATPLAKLPAVLDDPYTLYLDSAKLTSFQRGDTGTYAGVGVHARSVGAQIVIDRVVARSPAARAGIRAGDVLVSAGGRPLAGLPLEKALNQVRGRVGTTVAVQLQRGRQHLRMVLRRAEVQARIVSHQVRHVSGQAVGYVQVLEFSRGIGRQVRLALADFKARGVSMVVLDLRGNGGGLVSEAVALTADFTPAGTPVFSESGRHFAKTRYRTRTGPADTATPLAVLVDGQSASAAEIVTGALHDADRATVVGARTFGKGVIQDLVPLKGGGALKYTMAEYLTPSGHRVNKQGITPDVAVTSPVTSETDPALDAAVRDLKR